MKISKVVLTALGMVSVLVFLGGNGRVVADQAAVGPGPGDREGGEIPVPYKKLNTKVELADGEYYVLRGKVVFRNNKPLFQVDLDAHPWLANAKRVVSPFYPLDSDTDWERYAGSRIQVTIKADHKLGTTGRNGSTSNNLGLRALDEPKLLGD